MAIATISPITYTTTVDKYNIMIGYVFGSRMNNFTPNNNNSVRSFDNYQTNNNYPTRYRKRVLLSLWTWIVKYQLIAFERQAVQEARC